jgi:hypothetical protein
LVTPVKAQDTPGLGPYRLLRQLADGGVFLAERPGGQPAVVRAIAAARAADPQFRAEVAAARQVSPAFATPVVDADLDNAAPWLATAYVTGPSLAETVREQGPLPASTVLGLAAGLAEGLRDMHAVGLVHRNLRPSNVLLTQDGPRLTGFGTWNATEVPGMDPRFLSPEQVLADDVGPAGDIFSLGAVLAFAATGHGPFGSGSSAALMYRLVNSPAQLDDVSAELRTVVASCLDKQPGDRPTASGLLAVLGAVRPQGGTTPRPGPAGGSADPPPALAGGSAGGRRGRPRSLTPVLVTASLLAAVVAGVLALTGALFPAGSGPVGPQAGTVVAAAGPGSPAAGGSAPSGAAGLAPVSSRGSGVYLPSGHSDGVTPSTLGGSITAALVSLPSSVAAPPSSAAPVQPAPSGSRSGSAAPTKSAPASAPASSSSSASPTASASSSASSSSSASPAPSSSGSSSSPAPTTSSSAPSSPAPSSSAAPSSSSASSPPANASASASSS